MMREMAGAAWCLGALAFVVWSTTTDIERARNAPHIGDRCGHSYHWADYGTSFGPIDLSCEPDHQR